MSLLKYVDNLKSDFTCPRKLIKENLKSCSSIWLDLKAERRHQPSIDLFYIKEACGGRFWDTHQPIIAGWMMVSVMPYCLTYFKPIKSEPLPHA
jgi:hypothetical protein